MRKYAFGPLRDNEEHFRVRESDKKIHYEINPTKIMFRGVQLSTMSDRGKRKFETLLILNSPQKHVTVSFNSEL